jgi:hypothetical protein
LEATKKIPEKQKHMQPAAKKKYRNIRQQLQDIALKHKKGIEQCIMKKI